MSGYTASKMLHDGPHKKGKLRLSRAAAVNIVPANTMAATALGSVIPSLKGKLTGSAVRVPVTTGCLITLIAVVSAKELTAENVNKVMKENASEVYGYTEEEYVSSDIVGITYGSLFDATQTSVCKVSDTEFEVKVAAWFDNENSFASQMVRTAVYVAGL